MCEDRRPAQYFGLIVTFGLAWGILAALVNPTAWWSWTALAVVALLRIVAALAIGRGVLEDPCVVRRPVAAALAGFRGARGMGGELCQR